MSSRVYILSHVDPPHDFITSKTNKTFFYKTIIVPNDPSDFTRNSYDTQTINNVMETLHHKHIDILKIETLAHMPQSYELLHFLVKDGILKQVSQLHFAIIIGKLYMFLCPQPERSTGGI